MEGDEEDEDEEDLDFDEGIQDPVRPQPIAADPHWAVGVNAHNDAVAMLNRLHDLAEAVVARRGNRVNRIIVDE